MDHQPPGVGTYNGPPVALSRYLVLTMDQQPGGVGDGVAVGQLWVLSAAGNQQRLAGSGHRQREGAGRPVPIIGNLPGRSSKESTERPLSGRWKLVGRLQVDRGRIARWLQVDRGRIARSSLNVINVNQASDLSHL